MPEVDEPVELDLGVVELFERNLGGSLKHFLHYGLALFLLDLGKAVHPVEEVDHLWGQFQ